MSFCPAHLNLFRTSRIEAIPYHFVPGMCWDTLEDRLEKLGGRGCILGGHGTGKTTLIEEWRLRLLSARRKVLRLRLTEDSPRIQVSMREKIRQLGPEDFLFLDGAEQLDFFRWRAFLKDSCRVGHLVSSSHRGGRLPVLMRTNLTVELAEQLVTELLGGSGALASFGMVGEGLRRHRGNLRELFFELYDQEADRGE